MGQGHGELEVRERQRRDEPEAEMTEMETSLTGTQYPADISAPQKPRNCEKGEHKPP